MAQVRIKKEGAFSVFENSLLQNPNLSLKAKGLLVYMLSLPEDWDYSITGLSTKCKEGKSSIRSAISELIAEGYITRHLARDGKGVLTGYEYIVYEHQHPSCENETTVEPSCDYPTSGNPSSENRTQQNNNITKKEIDPPYSPPKGEAPARKRKRSNEPKEAPDWKPERFAAFWAAYPCGKSKQAAIRAWDKLKPDDALIHEMALGLKRAMKSEEWQRGIGIPYASTWLNNRRWEDEDKPQPSAGTAPSIPSAPRSYHLEVIDGEEVVVYDG